MERRIGIKLAEMGTVLFLTAGVTVLGYKHVEEESLRPTLLQKGENLELYGTCQTGEAAMDELKELLQPGDTAAIGGFGEYLILSKVNSQALETSATNLGANAGGAIGFGGRFSESPFPGINKVQASTMAIISSDPEYKKNIKPFEIPPKSYHQSEQTIEQLTATLICPTRTLSALIRKFPWSS